MEEKFEGTKDTVHRRRSDNAMDKTKNKCWQDTTQKIKDWGTPAPQRTGGELRCSENE